MEILRRGKSALCGNVRDLVAGFSEEVLASLESNGVPKLNEGAPGGFADYVAGPAGRGPQMTGQIGQVRTAAEVGAKVLEDPFFSMVGGVGLECGRSVQSFGEIGLKYAGECQDPLLPFFGKERKGPGIILVSAKLTEIRDDRRRVAGINGNDNFGSVGMAPMNENLLLAATAIEHIPQVALFALLLLFPGFLHLPAKGGEVEAETFGQSLQPSACGVEGMKYFDAEFQSGGLLKRSENR